MTSSSTDNFITSEVTVPDNKDLIDPLIQSIATIKNKDNIIMGLTNELSRVSAERDKAVNELAIKGNINLSLSVANMMWPWKG